MGADFEWIAEGLRGLAVPMAALHEDPANARKGHAVERIAASLKAYGQRKPVVAGEKFRANLARIICDAPQRVVVDEFTSVVDRQIARMGALATWEPSWGREPLFRPDLLRLGAGPEGFTVVRVTR